MKSAVRKRLAHFFWPRYSLTFDLVNRHAQFLETVNSYPAEGIREFPDRAALHAGVSRIIGNVPITYLEFGVWKGESILAWTKLNTNPGSRFYGFDSFEGLPEDWVHHPGTVTGRGRFSLNGEAPAIPDSRVKLVRGWFQHTLRGFLREVSLPHPIIVHNDSDLHSSTLYTLTTLDPCLEAGDIIMFDEYSSPLNEHLAWEEYKRAFMREADCIAMSHNWWHTVFQLR